MWRNVQHIFGRNHCNKNILYFQDKSVPKFPQEDGFQGFPPKEHQDLFRRPLGTDNDGTFKHLLNVPEGKLKSESVDLGKQQVYKNIQAIKDKTMQQLFLIHVSSVYLTKHWDVA